MLKLGENEKMRFTQSLKPGVNEEADFQTIEAKRKVECARIVSYEAK